MFVLDVAVFVGGVGVCVAQLAVTVFMRVR
jgi:hypothetical protein